MGVVFHFTLVLLLNAVVMCGTKSLSEPHLNSTEETAKTSLKCPLWLNLKKAAKSKKLSDAFTADNGQYKFVGRLEYRVDRNERFTGTTGLTGAFVSFAARAKFRRYYFIVPASVWYSSFQLRSGRYGNTKWDNNFNFYTIRDGLARITYGSQRSSSLLSAKPNPLAKYLVIDPKQNTIRVNSWFSHKTLNKDTEMSAVELKLAQAKEVIDNGGEFFDETSAYVGTPVRKEKCMIVAMGGLTGVSMGAQISYVEADTSKCRSIYNSAKRSDDTCFELLSRTKGGQGDIQIIQPKMDVNDIGSPIVCRRGGKEILLTHLSQIAQADNVIFAGKTTALRNFLQLVFSDAAIYVYDTAEELWGTENPLELANSDRGKYLG